MNVYIIHKTNIFGEVYMNIIENNCIKKYTAIIFDVGDTLLEHYPNQAQIYIDRIKSLDLYLGNISINDISQILEKTSHEQIIKEQNGSPRMSDKGFENMLDKAVLDFVNKGQDNSALLEKLIQIPLPEQELRIIPGVIDTLTALQEKGFRLAIVSNHRNWLPDYLEKIGLSKYFETIVVSDIVGYEKPDIRIMQIVLERLSLSASDCLYVGDHPFDVLCSKGAGIDCVWLATPEKKLPKNVHFKEDFRISKINDIIKLV
jgi:putative hydrolase of the HAD superfamily